MKVRDKVAIGWLDPGHVEGLFALSVANIFAERRARIDALIRIEAGGLLSRGRNELVAGFMDNCDAEWLLMLDSDEQLTLDGFDRLIDSVHDVDRPIMAGLYFGAWPGDLYPTACPLIFRKQEGTSRFLPIMDYPPNSVIPIDSAGTGCLLIHRTVFEEFRATATPHQGANWCWFLDMPVNGDWFSEDHYFCARALTLGFPIHANTGVVLPHRKRFWLSDKHHTPPKPETATFKPADETVTQLRPVRGTGDATDRARVPR